MSDLTARELAACRLAATRLRAGTPAADVLTYLQRTATAPVVIDLRTRQEIRA